MRPKLVAREAPQPSVAFTPSGSFLLDLVLGGGWAQGRVVNIVGDRSSGKTLLAIEACANFARLHGPDYIRYAEAEAAFDKGYAATLGMPDGIDFAEDIATVEQFYGDLEGFLKEVPEGKPSLYILDSLDALSDTAEMEREIGDGSYGATKAKKLSELFRRLVSRLSDANCTLFIISQVRDKIGVMFGETKTRSGGRALDFYASQILWLTEIGKIERTVMGNKRAIGVRVKAKTKKNKVGMAFRDAEFELIFNYGIDDEISMLTWLGKGKVALPEIFGNEKDAKQQIERARLQQDRATLRELNAALRGAVQDQWRAIETELEPALRKYD